MVSDYLKIYLDDTLKLAKTLVIKSDDAAEAVNDWVKLVYGEAAVDQFDPSSWKYYQNICGIYHFSDMVEDAQGYLVPSIRIKSLDEADPITGEPKIIDFTKEELRRHVTTRLSYQYGSRFYYSLVNDHPDKEQLILGVLYPAEMQTAIAAKHGTILTYPDGLVEPQEATLIYELNEWLEKFNARWHVKAFGTSDGLYPAAQHAVMYLSLVPKILNLRLRRCKTPEAHSFHIREYLASHGRFDRYLDYLTLKQRLFLYRNLLYIERHAGQKATFFWLMQKLLTDRFIPLAEYSARLTTEFDKNYYPKLKFRRRPLNPEINGPERDYFDLDETLTKELPDALYNEAYVNANRQQMELKFKNSVSAVTQTKLLESVIYDYNNVAVYEKTEIVLQHWATMSAGGDYTALISYRDPTDGTQRVLTAEKAFVYMMYCTMRSMGVTLDKVIDLRTSRVLRPGTRSPAELLRLVNKRFVDKTDKVNQLLDTAPQFQRCISIHAFSQLTESIYQFSKKQWRDVSQTQNYIRRVELQNMYTVFYQDTWARFSDTGMDFRSWLIKEGLLREGLLDESYGEIAKAVYAAGAGVVVDETKLIRNIQKYLISAFKQLTSYTLQHTYQTNDDSIKLINWPTVRLGDIDNAHYAGNAVSLPAFVLGDKLNETGRLEHRPVTAKVRNTYVEETESKFQIDLPKVSLSIKTPGVISSFVMQSFRCGAVIVRPNSSARRGSLSYQNTEDFASLTNDEKFSLTDQYGTQHIFNPI